MENNRDSKFLTGFIWGAVIGAGIVFLLGTKKGKKLLKTISEEGISSLSDLLEQTEESEYDVSNNSNQEQEKKTNGELNHEIKEENKKPSIRRFFRRSSK